MSEIAEGTRTRRQREALETLWWRVSADEGRVGGVVTPPSESLMAHQKKTLRKKRFFQFDPPSGGSNFTENEVFDFTKGASL